MTSSLWGLLSSLVPLSGKLPLHPTSHCARFICSFLKVPLGQHHAPRNSSLPPGVLPSLPFPQQAGLEVLFQDQGVYPTLTQSVCFSLLPSVSHGEELCHIHPWIPEPTAVSSLLSSYPLPSSKHLCLSFSIDHGWSHCMEVWMSRGHPTFQFPAERFWSDPAEPSKVAGLELSARRVRYGFTTDGCHSISTPLGDFDSPGIGPTPSHWKTKNMHWRRRSEHSIQHLKTFLSAGLS